MTITTIFKAEFILGVVSKENGGLILHDPMKGAPRNFVFLNDIPQTARATLDAHLKSGKPIIMKLIGDDDV